MQSNIQKIHWFLLSVLKVKEQSSNSLQVVGEEIKRLVAYTLSLSLTPDQITRYLSQLMNGLLAKISPNWASVHDCPKLLAFWSGVS